MPTFSIRYPFFILMLCLMILVVGVATTVRMPVDLFPEIKIPVVVVATFYGGMPAATDRSQYHRHVRAVLHAGKQHRPY